MSAGPLVTDILAALLLAAVILYRYGDWYRHHIIVTLAVLVAWCFSFLIIFVLPLDVSSVSNIAYLYMSSILLLSWQGSFLFSTVVLACLVKYTVNTIANSTEFLIAAI